MSHNLDLTNNNQIWTGGIAGLQNLKRRRGRDFSASDRILSQTHKLITQINRVCQEIHDIKLLVPKMTHSPLSSYHTNKELLPNTCEKDGKDCTCLTDNKKHVHYEDLQNSPSIQTCHETSSLPELPPPEQHELTSSHASSEASSSEPSASCSEPPSCWTGDTSASMMVLSSSQKESKESLEEQDLRGGGLPGPIKTKEWRSWKEVGIGDCLKSPTMAH